MMSDLTRKLVGPDNWGVFHAGVQVGHITRRQLAFNEIDWVWSLGFHPLMPSRRIESTGDTFDQARAALEADWPRFRSSVTEAEFQERRDQDAWTARKYELWDRGEQLPRAEYEPGKPVDRLMRSDCGIVFDMFDPPQVQTHVPHIEAAKAARRKPARQ